MLKCLPSFVVVAVVLVACSSDDGGGSAVTRSSLLEECNAAEQCDGLLCLTLNANAQKKTGICTAKCTDDSGCGGGKCTGIPASLGASAGVSRICLASCATDAECANGFVCAAGEEGSVCLVRSAGAPVPCTEDAQCTEAKAQCFTSSAGVKSCSRALDAADVFARDCTGAEQCPGFACLTLQANAQNKTGICTMRCTDDTDCPGGVCFESGTGKSCLATCTPSAAGTGCPNGFACLAESATSARGICLVRAL